MPLIDIHLAVSGLDPITLEQTGIIANFLAGILLAFEYFMINDKINKINDKLENHISRAYNRLFKAFKRYSKLNRRVVLVVLLVVVLLAVYQTMLYHNESLKEYMIFYYGLLNPILIPMRRILFGLLSVLAVLFLILSIARYTPKRTIGALGILFFALGNALLFLSTLFE